MTMNYDAYQSQDPSDAYTRWLAEREGTQGLSFPIRQLLEARGRYQSRLAPLFGFGIDQSIGGQGRDFAPFYSQRGGAAPGWEEMRGRLREAQGAVKAGSNASPYQLALSGKYQDPQDQLEALQASMGSQVNPYLQGGLSRVLSRRFGDQQATAPEESFFDYAQRKGYF